MGGGLSLIRLAYPNRPGRLNPNGDETTDPGRRPVSTDVGRRRSPGWDVGVSGGREDGRRDAEIEPGSSFLRVFQADCRWSGWSDLGSTNSLRPSLMGVAHKYLGNSVGGRQGRQPWR